MIYAVIFLTSAAFMAYEVNFTRVFSFAQWHNLSSVIITMALLGSGAAGTFISLRSEAVSRHFNRYLFVMALIFPLCTAGGFVVSVMLPVNPYGIGFSTLMVLYVFLYFAFMALPFFSGSAIICISLMKKPPSGAYGVNLFGSGAGCIMPLALSYHVHPYGIMAVIIIMAFIPAVIMALHSGRKVPIAAVCGITPVIAAAVFFSLSPGSRTVSEYKPVSGALNLPASRIIHESYSPLSVIQVVQAEGLRSSAGLSLVSPYKVPVQRMIFSDGDSPSPVAVTGESGYIRYLSSWLPYYMKGGEGRGRALVIGAGGGEPVLKAIEAGFGSIDAVEINSAVIGLMKGPCAYFPGALYLDSRVTVYHDEGRSFARRSSALYDLVDIPMVDAFNSAASGVYALNESYLYTVESFMDFYKRLAPGGILSVTRWITTPPRDPLRMFNTAVSALERIGVDPARHIIAVRSVQTLTIMVSASPFTPDDIARVKRFCRSRLFDIVYCPGMTVSGADSNIRQDGGLLYRSFAAILSPGREEFTRSYDSDISAPHDNRPYFYNFFRPAYIRYIVKYGSRQVPVTEWGYLLLVIILIPVAVISFASIVYPLRRRGSAVIKVKRGAVPFFSLIAAGYFFIEMPLIQKMVLFLGSPVFSLSLVISTLLVFSGIGSFCSDSFFMKGRGILRCALAVCCLVLLYTFSLDSIFSLAARVPLYGRIIIVMALIAPPAFFMGMPFPKGLALMQKENMASVPYAWGVNGFFSVISIIAAALCAVVCGYRAVLSAAVIFYLCAGIISPADDTSE